MKNIIISNLVDKFKQVESLSQDLQESEIFEHFSNYCIVSNEYQEEFNILNIRVAGGNDLGIDGIAIIVNGSLINDVEELEDLITRNKLIEATLIFIQAKSGENFEGSEFSNFVFGIKNFFDFQSKLNINDELKHKQSLIKKNIR